MSMGKTCCGTDKPPNSPTGSTDDILLVGLQVSKQACGRPHRQRWVVGWGRGKRQGGWGLAGLGLGAMVNGVSTPFSLLSQTAAGRSSLGMTVAGGLTSPGARGGERGQAMLRESLQHKMRLLQRVPRGPCVECSGHTRSTSWQLHLRGISQPCCQLSPQSPNPKPTPHTPDLQWPQGSGKTLLGLRLKSRCCVLFSGYGHVCAVP